MTLRELKSVLDQVRAQERYQAQRQFVQPHGHGYRTPACIRMPVVQTQIRKRSVMERMGMFLKKTFRKN